MITGKDIEKMLAAFIPIFATKDDLRQMEEKLVTKEELEEFKNGAYNGIDKTYKEVITMRQEQAAHQLQHEDINEDLRKIKAIPTIAHELKK